jgi:enolase
MTATRERYVFKKSDGSEKTAEELVDYYAELCARFPIISIEGRLRGERLGRLEKIDEKTRLEDSTGRRRSFRHEREVSSKGIAEHVANSILIKVNQIGTLTETLATIDVAKKNELHDRDQSSLG